MGRDPKKPNLVTRSALGKCAANRFSKYWAGGGGGPTLMVVFSSLVFLAVLFPMDLKESHCTQHRWLSTLMG